MIVDGFGEFGSSRAVRGSWVRNVTLGEFAGFLVPTAVWAALATAGASDAAVFAPVVLAGAAEGSLLGYAQSRVLRRAIAGFPAREWIRNTALAAACAWAVGLLPSLLSALVPDAPGAVFIVLGIGGSLIILPSIGFAQWLVLRRFAARAGVWVWANVAGWLAGLPFTFAAMMLAPSHPALARAACAALGGLAMAFAVAVVTGIALVHVLRDADRRHEARWRI